MKPAHLQSVRRQIEDLFCGSLVLKNRSGRRSYAFDAKSMKALGYEVWEPDEFARTGVRFWTPGGRA